MATFYIDYENGSSTADGTSVANKRSFIENLSGVAAGDTIKIAGSPNPTLIGTGDVQQGKWYSNYAGQSNGTITYSTSSGQTNIYRSSHGFVTGDTIVIYGNTQGENINGTWEVARVDDNNFKLYGYAASINGTASGSGGKHFPTSNKRIILDSGSACTKNLVSCGKRSTAWTAATDVTTALVEDTSPEWNSNSRKTIEHNYVDQITVSSSHGTGLAAYKTSDTSLIYGNGDDNDYHQISFMICQTSGTYTDGISIRATNSSGATSLRTVPVDFTNCSSYRWFPVTLDFGEPIINSGMSNLTEISLYVDTDHGARTFLISNVIACKDSSEADSLTHSSLIGLNTTADPCWYPIESIYKTSSGTTRVMIWTSSVRASPNGYYGVGRNVGFSADFDGTNIYKRETIKATYLRSQLTGDYTYKDYWSFSVGTSSNPLTISGGWSSDFTTQNLDHSLIDATIGRGSPKIQGAHTVIEKVGFVRFNIGVEFANSGPFTVDKLAVVTYGESIAYKDQSSTQYKKLNIDWLYQGYQNRVTLNGSAIDSSGNNATSADKANFNANLYSINASSAGLYFGGSNGFVFNNLNIHGSGWYGPAIKWQDACAGLYYIENLKCTCGYNGIIKTNGGGCTLQIVNATFRNMSGYLIQMSKPDTYLGTTFSETIGGDGKLWQMQADGFWLDGNAVVQITNGPTLTTRRNQVRGNAVFQTKNDSITGSYSSSPISFDGNFAVWQRKDANQVSGAVENYYKIGKIFPNTTTRKTASGYSWKLSTQYFNNATSGSPVAINLGTIAVNASALVTVKVWTYRTANTIIGRLKVKQNGLIGLTSDSTAVTSGNTNEWVEISTTFTPTASGFADIALEAYDGAGWDIYFDDLTITQA